MQQPPHEPDPQSFLERRATFRTAYVDGRQARLVDRNRLILVRLLDESLGGFRIATVETCELPEQARTILQLDGRAIPVRIVYKRVEGPRTMLGLQRMPISDCE